MFTMLYRHSEFASLLIILFGPFSQKKISERTLKVPQNSLTFTASRRAAFDIFGMMLNETFGLSDVLESQGEYNGSRSRPLPIFSKVF